MNISTDYIVVYDIHCFMPELLRPHIQCCHVMVFISNGTNSALWSYLRCLKFLARNRTIINQLLKTITRDGLIIELMCLIYCKDVDHYLCMTYCCRCTSLWDTSRLCMMTPLCAASRGVGVSLGRYHVSWGRLYIFASVPSPPPAPVPGRAPTSRFGLFLWNNFKPDFPESFKPVRENYL